MDSDVKRSAADEGPKHTAWLARAVQRGDVGRFDELYAHTAPALYAWAALRAPPSVDPGDILGEVWLRAIERLRSHDSENCEFRAWIFGIAKHVLLQVLRMRGRDRAPSRLGGGASGGSSGGLDQLPDSVTSISQRLAHEDSMRCFLDYAKRLESTDRDLLVHCGVEGGTCRDAATRLGLTDEAATKRWQRLRVELRESPWVRGLLLPVE
jgi:RNA polymerase sigma-70 factor (ECF subfamily)